MYRPKELVRRAARIRRTEGVASLTRQALELAVRQVFRHETYYLRTHLLHGAAAFNEADFMPRVDDVVFRTVAGNGEADELEEQGLEFRSRVLGARKRLSSGAVALCIFVGGELANIGWLAMTKRAQRSLGEPPVDIDFAGGVVWTGGVWTDPRYRRLGLSRYHIFKKHEFLIERGVVAEVSVMATTNTAIQGAAGKLGGGSVVEGRYLRVLWWESWREKPVTVQEQEGMATQDAMAGPPAERASQI